MGNPVIILVVGMPGVGKTTAIRLAAQQFARLGLKTTRLDVDRFSRLFLEDYKPEGILNPTLKERISFILEGLKQKAMRALSTGENIAAHPQAKEAVKAWIREQRVDIIFLEFHWPKSIIHYPHHELWLVTAPPAKCLRQMHASQQKPEELALLRLKAGIYSAQQLWGKSYHVLPQEKFLISNASFGRNAMRYRLHKRIETIAMCYEDGRYEDEDERSTFPPPA